MTPREGMAVEVRGLVKRFGALQIMNLGTLGFR